MEDKKYSILVVDDQLENINQIIECFKASNLTYSVLRAFDGEMALKIMDRTTPDLIITDWEMPNMDGITYIKRLKEKEQFKDIPVIMCTGVMTSSQNLQTALDAGAVDYVKKPVDAVELTARMSSMLKLSNLLKQVKSQNENLLLQKEEIEQANEEIMQQRDILVEQGNAIEESYASVVLMNDIGREITSHLEIGRLLEVVYGQVNSMLKSDVFTIGLFNKKENVLSMHVREKGENLPMFQYSIDDENRLGVWCFRNKKPVLINDMDAEYTDYFAVRQQPVSGQYVRSIIYIPLVAQSEYIGVMSVQAFIPGVYSQRQFNMLENIANFVSIAVANAENHEKSEKLLLNILPGEVAEELKELGKVEPKYYKQATVLFTDFKGFTQLTEKITPREALELLNFCFTKFDEICVRHNLEKIKTIGDAYMAVGGVPAPNSTNACDCVAAGLEMQAFMAEWKIQRDAQKLPAWELRLGIHSGELIAGVIGDKKFAYDVWGDTVNTASRMESSGDVGRVNISGFTHDLVKSTFKCEYRGKISAKGKGDVDMYFVTHAH